MREFIDEILEKGRIVDLLLIALVPLILTAVYSLPQSVQSTLILDLNNPSAVNLWTSAYVHRGFGHFANNLIGYSLLILLIYPLLILANERRFFRGMFLSFLFALPPVIGLLNIATIGSGSTAGFSGIGSAFLGLLAFSLMLFLHNRISPEIQPTHGVILFLITGGMVAFIYSSPTTAAGIFLVTVLTGILYARRIDFQAANIVAQLTAVNGYPQLVLFAGLVYLIVPISLFPQEIAQGGTTVNIFSHYLGLVSGFFGASVYWTFR
jgi:hypothetical protein